MSVEEVAKDFSQLDLVSLYGPEVDGLCSGLVIEFARHYYAHKAKGTKSDFIAKLNKQLAAPTESFLERVKAYQEYYQPAGEKVIYREAAEISKILSSPNFSSSEILGLLITPIGNFKEDPHAISIQIERNADGVIYTIFDPNIGIVTLDSITSCNDALLILKQHYLEVYDCTNVSITAVDLGPKLKEIGLVSERLEEVKEAKHHYKFIEAITSGDIQKILELNKDLKIDYQDFTIVDRLIQFPNSLEESNFMPDNPLEFAISELSEQQIIQIIQSNTKIDLTKSLEGIITTLIMTNKLSIPVIEALHSKLPADTSWLWDLFSPPSDELAATKALLHCFKNLVETNTAISLVLEDKHLHLKIDADDPVILKYMVGMAAEINAGFNFELSKHTDEDGDWGVAETICSKNTVELHLDFNLIPAGFLPE